MHTLENLTEFALTCLPLMSFNGQDLAVLIVAGTYVLPAPGAGKTNVRSLCRTCQSTFHLTKCPERTC
jgi:hypothetical protein